MEKSLNKLLLLLDPSLRAPSAIEKLRVLEVPGSPVIINGILFKMQIKMQNVFSIKA